MTSVPSRLRSVVVSRAGERCEYCHLPQATQVATFPVDHVAPLASGGETELGNLALACPQCNALKWTHTDAADPGTGEVVPLFDPRTQKWEEHFRWSSTDPAALEPLTPSARATLALLDLNSEIRRNIRRWLAEIGSHP